MRSLICLLATCVLWSMQVEMCYAQWVQTNGPEGAGVNCFAVLDTNLFAGTLGSGVFRSTDRGKSWIFAGEGLMCVPINTLAVCNHRLFVGAMGGLFLSTNNGGSWDVINDGLPDFQRDVRAFAACGTKVFAGIYGADYGGAGGVFLSEDSGKTWIPVHSGFMNNNVTSLVASDTILFVGTRGGGVYRTTDGGLSWEFAIGGLQTLEVNALLIDGEDLIAGTASRGVFLSKDYGRSWNPINSGFPDLKLEIDILASDGTNLFAQMEGRGIFRSSDHGNTWSSDNVGIVHANALCSHGTDLFAGTSGSVYLSTNAGTDWSRTDKGLVGSTIGSIATMGSKVFAGTYGCFVSSNAGREWTLAEGMQNKEVSVMTVSGSNLFAGTGGTGIFLSPDTGKTWASLDSGAIKDWVTGLLVGDMTLFAGTVLGVYRLDKKESGWTVSNVGLRSSRVVALTSNNGVILAGCGYGGIYRSTDNGVSWTGENSGIKGADVTSLAVAHGIIFAGARGYYGGMYRSTNDGLNWTYVGIWPREDGVRIISVIGNNIIKSTFGGLLLSTDTGESWADINSGLGCLSVLSLAASKTDLYVGTEKGGVWRRPLSEITSVRQFSVSVPLVFSLFQNYPNPFNPSTTIRYGLPQQSFVSLAVYSVLGQLVTQLVNEQQEPGYHEAVFRGDGLAGGIYFFQIRAGDYVSTKKLLLLR